MISHPMMTTRILIRRAAVIAAVTLSLALGALAVRAAADWTAASAPLTVKPESAASLTQKLADEQARSAALEQQLASLTGQTDSLTTALTSAGDRIASDAQTAKALRAKLAAAQKKLAALNRAAQRSGRNVSAPRKATSSTRPSSGGGGGDDGGEGGEPKDD